MSDPMAWLRAQIEARKATAEAATQGEWINEAGSIHCGHETNLVVDWIYENPDAAHIVGNQPRDAIARCDAELEILDYYAAQDANPARLHDAALQLQWHVLGEFVRILAKGYQHRDGYQEMWAR